MARSFKGLAARAFADVKKNHEASQERMRREIAAERERVLAELSRRHETKRTVAYVRNRVKRLIAN